MLSLRPKLRLTEEVCNRHCVTGVTKTLTRPSWLGCLYDDQGTVQGYFGNAFSVPKYSINTLAPERCVKQATEAAASVVGQDRRDGYVRARIQSREQMPSFKTKKDIMVTFSLGNI